MNFEKIEKLHKGLNKTWKRTIKGKRVNRTMIDNMETRLIQEYREDGSTVF